MNGHTDGKRDRDISEIVKLNVGGVIFVTTRTTLCSKGKNFFTGLLNGNIPSTKYEDCLFIDRDGEHFKPVLEYLRSGNFVRKRCLFS